MFFNFNKNKQDKIAKAIEEAELDQNYWAVVRKQFFKNRLAVWALFVFFIILFIAVFGDFLANERPIYCSLKMEQVPDTIDVKSSNNVNIDTLKLAITERIPAPAKKQKTDEKLDKGVMICKVTATKVITKTSFLPIANNLNDSTQQILQIDSITTQTTISSIDSITETYFPVFRQYLVDLGFVSWNEKFISKKWLEQEYESVIFPPITYSPNTQDRGNSKFRSPAGPQDFEKNPNGGWHYLGTERLGLDIASGLIHGTRTAMLVGIVAMSIAMLLGLFFGAISGYFGDEGMKVSRIRIILNLLGLFLAVFYSFITYGYYFGDLIAEGRLFSAIGYILLIFITLFLVTNGLVWGLKKIPFLAKKVTLPLDILVMRLIEMLNSIPLLVLILAIVSIIEKPSVMFVMVILGLVSWTGIAKFVRAELLRIRRLEYIEAAQAFGYSEFRIIMRHALPNTLAPVLIAIAFGIASAILIEAYLSFLGVGVPDDQITWGSLLNMARDKISAWWLAIFPGSAIFITVTIFNLIGEGLTEALDPKMRE